MKYISNIDGVTIFDEYFEYIESVKHNLPLHVYEFASNYKHFNLTDHSSLHDAWLNSLRIEEPATGERAERRGIEIVANYLGPFHDREINLRYKNVQSFDLEKPKECASPPILEVGCGDLLLHEIRIENESTIVHELEFSRGSHFIIKCKDIIHSESIFEKNR